MKPLPAPRVPGTTEFQRFDNAVRQVLTVSKSELLKREQREQDRKNGKRKGDRRSKPVAILSRQESSLGSIPYFAKYIITDFALDAGSPHFVALLGTSSPFRGADLNFMQSG